MLFDNSNQIVVAPKSLYNYIIRGDSITTSGFSEKKLELIRSTTDMTSFVLKKYPTLKKACRRRMMWAHLSVLSSLCRSKFHSKKIRKQLIKYISNNRRSVLSDRNITNKERFILNAGRLGYPAYWLLFRLYEWRKNG